ncbi:MAG: hypothetical protein ACRDE6_00870 [Candidatus Limnocylindria bacterium]
MRLLFAIALSGVLSACAAAGDRVEPSDAVTTEPECEPPAWLGTGIEALQAYGADHPDEFGGMYIDPPGGQHVVMLFTDGLAEHACAADAMHPGTTVRAVEHTLAELNAIIESIDHEALQAEGIEMLSAGVDDIANRAYLEAKSNDPTVETRLELAHGGMLDVTIHPFPGEWHDVEAGDGWRLLAAGEGGLEAYTVDAATDDPGYEQLWDGAGLPDEAPAVDMASEVIVAFGHGIGSGCREVRLDGVRVADSLVWSVTSDPLQPRSCDADLAGTYVFVVAVARDAVPDGFTLWLNEYAASRSGEFSAPLEVDLP